MLKHETIYTTVLLNSHKSQVYMNVLFFSCPLIYEAYSVSLKSTLCHTTEFSMPEHTVVLFSSYKITITA